MAPRTRLLACAAIVAAAAFQIHPTQAAGLRRTMESWRLEEDAHNHEMQQEKTLEWLPRDDGSFTMAPLGKMSGDEAIVVFHDRTLSEDAASEAAVVTFDVRSSANCVVNVCGSTRNWIMQSSEQCWELKIAHKSSDPSQNGLIRGLSAAFTPGRPTAKKLYLKFDPVNFIDGSLCEYELFAGNKQNVSSSSYLSDEAQEES